MQKNAQLTLQTDDAPDVAMYNQGTSSVGDLASQGILADLTEYAEQYGWTESLPNSIQTIAKYKADEGGIMSEDGGSGTASRFKASSHWRITTKTCSTSTASPSPRRSRELGGGHAVVRRSGVTRVAFEGNETAAQHLVRAGALEELDRPVGQRLPVLLSVDLDWNSEPFTYAAEKFAESVDKGYIPNNSGGLVAEDMITQFCAGEYPIMFSGSWWFGRIQQDGAFTTVFRAFPGNENFDTGATGKLSVVPETSKHKDLAAELPQLPAERGRAEHACH